MLRVVCGLLLVSLISLAGCANRPLERDDAEMKMFGPTRMRLHPIFTTVKNWSDNGTRPDGIEAEIEFQDQFGDPTKAAGKIMFELWDYRVAYPDPKGNRLVNPWVGSLLTLQEQYEHWNRTSRTYTFQLAYPQVSPRRTYVLTAMFEHTDGRRFFSQIILKAAPQELRNPTTLPSLPAPTSLPSLPLSPQ